MVNIKLVLRSDGSNLFHLRFIEFLMVPLKCNVINKNLKIKKEVGITIKSKETNSKLASYPAMKSLATHSTSCTGY